MLSNDGARFSNRSKPAVLQVIINYCTITPRRDYVYQINKLLCSSTVKAAILKNLNPYRHHPSIKGNPFDVQSCRS